MADLPERAFAPPRTLGDDDYVRAIEARERAAQEGLPGYLRRAAGAIPDVQADDSSAFNAIVSRLGRTATAIPKAGLSTIANWWGSAESAGKGVGGTGGMPGRGYGFETAGLTPGDTIAPTGMAGVSAGAFAPHGAVGVFGGRLAKTADHEALAKAEQMAAAGASRDDIWNQTGWFQGGDGRWRFEIDDSGLKFKHGDISKPGDEAKGRLGDLVEHDELFAAYPELADRRTTIAHNFSTGEGETSPRVLGIGGNIAVRGHEERFRAPSLLHELQHQVQGKEGFARGSNPTLEWRPWDVLTEEGRLGLSSHQRYQDVKGEVEARNVAGRYRDPEKTEQPPYETADRRPEEQRNPTPLAAALPGLVARTPTSWPGIWGAGYLLGAWNRPRNSLLSDQSRSSLPGTVVNSLAEQKPGIRAYHGSPHDFDRFDVSKIGTGEGAQAYGHGLYFAENEGVARSYRDAGYLKIDGKDFDETNYQHIAAAAVHDTGSREAAIKSLEQQIPTINAAYDGAYRQRLLTALGILKRGEALPEVSPGRMYEVSINAKPEGFLDWDLPLSQQSEGARRAFESELRKHPLGPLWIDRGDIKDMSVGSVMGNIGHDSPTISRGLSDAGIKGIRYKDQGSRGKEGPGTHNYVVFNDRDVEILRKYGWVPVGMAGGGMMMAPPSDAQAADLPERAFAPKR